MRRIALFSRIIPRRKTSGFSIRKHYTVPDRQRKLAEPRSTIDQRGIPTHECFNCGNNIFTIHAFFENYDIAMWLLEGTCARCGSPVTVPCPVDSPEYRAEDN